MPTLEITTVSRCTIQCTYCPQDKLAAAYPEKHLLSVDNFRAVLLHVPLHVRIDFSGFVEPWLNPGCSEMLRIALGQGHNVAVYTTLQGMNDPLDVVDTLEAYADQVEVICLHLPDVNDNMPGFHANGAWFKALNAFLKLESSGAIKRFEKMAMSAEGVVEPFVPVERLTKFLGVDRAGNLNLQKIGSQPVEASALHEGPTTCSYTPFYDQNVLLPNGDVVLCCNDYGLQHKLGNLLVSEWAYLDRGKMLEMNLSGAHTLCETCNRATPYQTAADNRQMWVEGE